MKNIFIQLLLLISLTTFSQNGDSVNVVVKDTSWKVSGFFGVNASQTALSNWQGGGQNNVAINNIFSGEAVYKKGKIIWLNKLDAQYGVIKPGDDKLFKKNLDQLFAISKLDIDAFAKNFYYTTQADFRTQFAPGYNYNGDSISGRATSDFLSPGYTQLAFGLEYKPVKGLSIFVAPLAGKMTYVNRQYLADEGAYGVQKAVTDTAGNIIKHGKKSRYEFGGRLVLKFKKEINKKISIDSYLDLFSDYLHNPQNIDVVFNNLITIKIHKLFTASIICQMVYDDDIIIKRDWNKDGKYDNPHDINGPRLQVLSTFALGFGYKF